MDSKYKALVGRNTWVLVPWPNNNNAFICGWVFTLKFNLNRIIP